MPFPNQHAARVKAPTLFKQGSFRTKEITPGINIIMGRLKGETTMTTQAYRFEKSKFTVAQAKAWLKEHKIKTISFEKAQKKDQDDLEENIDNIEIGDIEQDSSLEMEDNQDNTSQDNSILYLDAFDNEKLWLIDKAEKTPEGFLKTRDIVTNTGIFNYLVKDETGKTSISRQLRDTDEVFKLESLDSLKNIPITMGHPKELITADNIKELQKKGVIIGFTGSKPRRDNHAVSIDMTITDKDAIDQIESGEKRALSCGYKANTDFGQSGYAFGNNRYDAQQKDIFYNHIALVEQGRAGDLAQVTLDSMDIIADNIAIQYIENQSKEDNMDGQTNSNNVVTTTIKIDGVDYSIDRDVAKHINALQTKVDNLSMELTTAKTSLSDAEGKRDAFEAEVKKLKEDAKDNELSDADLQAAVNQRMEICQIADSLEIKYDKDTSNKELKTLIITKKNDKIDLKDKDESYIDACFDTIKSFIKEDNDKKNKKKVFSDVRTGENPKDSSDQKTKEDMYNDFVEKVKRESENYQGAARVENGQVLISN